VNFRDFIREARPHMTVVVIAGLFVRALVVGAVVLLAIGHFWPAVLSAAAALGVVTGTAIYIADRMTD
jgi:CHASE2 domain-containing sensor protein